MLQGCRFEGKEPLAPKNVSRLKLRSRMGMESSEMDVPVGYNQGVVSHVAPK